MKKFFISLITFITIISITSTVFAASDITIHAGITGIRIEGAERYETSFKICEKYGNAKTVFLVSGKDFPDALAVAPLAAALNAPVLLTEGKTASQKLVNRIKTIGATEVYIIGGPAVISITYDNILEKLFTVKRIYGKDRYETSVKIAKELNKYYNSPQYFFTSASNYPDALAISSVAAILHSPIIYINKSGKLHETVTSFIQEYPCAVGIILGKEKAVANCAETNLVNASYMSVIRLGGTDRYETMLRINQQYNYLFNHYAVCMATGENYPDALSGATLAAKYRAPIILLPKNISKYSGIIAYVKEYKADMTYIFGGSAAVSDNVLKAFI